MRPILSRLIAGLAASQLLMAPIAYAECSKASDKSAFDVAGLKSELMVVALSCNVRDKYNSFVARYQPALQVQDAALNTYFRHAYGRRAQKEHDDYITQLANAQSEVGIKEGTLFCMHNAGLLDEVMKLPAGEGLADFAAGKGFTQPTELVCSRPAPVRHVARASVRRIAAVTQRHGS